MISLNSQVFLELDRSPQNNYETKNTPEYFSLHPQWNHKNGWKNVLNNLRLLIQPTILLWANCLQQRFAPAPWLDIFPDRHLLLGFHNLIAAINRF